MMQILDAKNPVQIKPGVIDLEVKFKELESMGYLTFTATLADIEAHGRELYVRAVAGDFGPIK